MALKRLNRRILAVGLALLSATALSRTPSRAAPAASPAPTVEARRPNIILIITDDQGYGDLGVNANPAVRTPNIDALAQASVRLRDFHVDPTCSPTRASLMTGQTSIRTGVWHTVMGRSLLPTEKVTLAEHLRDAGYATGIFGKWHLGDNYPFRPQDQGFGHVVIHQGGGVGQIPDHWGNVQKDDTYFVDGAPQTFKGRSTDVWFDEATRFIRANKDKPFFAYIATNAPHQPWRADEALVKSYVDRGLPRNVALFYAMISEIDTRVGALRRELAANGLERDTILIFMTDNGSSLSNKGGAPLPAMPGWTFNAGMRGFKADVYDGGHRVPFYISWPGGGLKPRTVDGLTAHFDIAPTLLALAGIRPKHTDFDGIDLSPAIRGGGSVPDRAIVVTNQRVDIPRIERPAAVMTSRWRLVAPDGKQPPELYDMTRDPGQARNVAAANPKVVTQLQASLRDWWATNAPRDAERERQRITIGAPAENPARLTAMDWMEAGSEADVPWFPGFQGPGESNLPVAWLGREDSFKPLPWYLTAARAGRYRISAYLHDKPAATPIRRKFAFIDLNGDVRSVPIDKLASWADFEADLASGPQRLKLWFANNEKGTVDVLPAFFAYAALETGETAR